MCDPRVNEQSIRDTIIAAAESIASNEYYERSLIINEYLENIQECCAGQDEYIRELYIESFHEKLIASSISISIAEECRSLIMYHINTKSLIEARIYIVLDCLSDMINDELHKMLFHEMASNITKKVSDLQFVESSHDHNKIVTQKSIIDTQDWLCGKFNPLDEGNANKERYIPSPEEVIHELCNARGAKWERGLHFFWNDFHDDPYRNFCNEMKDFPEIPLEYMLSPNEWRENNLDFIIRQVSDSPAIYQNLLLNIIDRYRIAARKRLLGIAERSYNSCVSQPYYSVIEVKRRINRQNKIKKTAIPFIRNDLFYGMHENIMGDLDNPLYLLDEEIKSTQNLVRKILVIQELLLIMRNAINAGKTDEVQIEIFSGKREDEIERPDKTKIPITHDDGRFNVKEEIQRAVDLHKPGDTWPDIVLDVIHKELFKLTASVPKATELFCEMYQIHGQENALYEAIKRRNRTKRNRVENL